MRICRDHDLGAEEAKSRVQRVAVTLEERFALRSEWRGNQLQFKGSGVNGQIAVSDSDIELNIRLGLALMFMESAIRSAIEEELDSEIGRD